MLTLDNGILIIHYTRSLITSHISKNPLNPPVFPPVFREKRGVFVTLHTYPDHQLRGCIGIPYPIMIFEEALKEAAISSTHDPRFHPLEEKELDHILIEVTILTKPSQITVQHPSDLPQQITIGKDGLIINYHGRSGLLLPQVSIEQGWDAEEFLTQLCFKAGLPPDAWFEDNAMIYQFSGQIFTEDSPNGNIREKKLDEL